MPFLPDQGRSEREDADTGTRWRAGVNRPTGSNAALSLSLTQGMMRLCG